MSKQAIKKGDLQLKYINIAGYVVSITLLLLIFQMDKLLRDKGVDTARAILLSIIIVNVLVVGLFIVSILKSNQKYKTHSIRFLIISLCTLAYYVFAFCLSGYPLGTL